MGDFLKNEEPKGNVNKSRYLGGKDRRILQRRKCVERYEMVLGTKCKSAGLGCGSQGGTAEQKFGVSKCHRGRGFRKQWWRVFLGS